MNGCAVRRVIGLRARLHGDGLGAFTESAERRSLRSAVGRVARLAQLTGEETDAEFLPGTHFARRGIDFCSVGNAISATNFRAFSFSASILR